MDKHMARIPTLRKLRQDACHNFKASLAYIVSSCQQEVHNKGSPQKTMQISK